ncbi:MAG: alpha/beta hydrolase-fold protein [Balneolaceae bacterium]|jgi:hypothetical protein
MKRLRSIHNYFFTLLAAFLIMSFSPPVKKDVNHKFSISFSKEVHETPITGRVILVLSKNKRPEPRFQAGSYFLSAPFWGKDVNQLKPGNTAVMDTAALGYPVKKITDLPEGDYYMQAVLNVYTKFNRSDGHTVWLPMDHWEGQHFNRSPGNLISKVKQIHFDPAKEQDFSVKLDSVIPPIELPADTKQVKHIKIKSELLSKFWGHPMYLGATVLLPKGYDTHPDSRYPVVYQQGHFNLRAPFGFTKRQYNLSERQRERLKNYNRESGFQFQESFNSEDFPRMIAVTFQHPTPFYDDSYTVNSANVGPYGDAIIQELIPHIENHYRIIQEPYARVLTGGSTGGWESLALQIYHPDFFGGTWSLYPDPLDFHRFQLIDLYEDSNAFYTGQISMGTSRSPMGGNTEWQPTLRFMMRDNDGQPVRTVQDMSRMEAVLGTNCRSGQQFNVFDAVFGPVGEDGYPVPLWDKRTGEINKKAVSYAREHGYDLTYYLEQNWPELGPKLKDKLHVYVGDADNFYLNLAVYRFQDFLEHTQNPHYEGTFEYGRPMKGHGWQPVTTSELLRMMAKHITDHAPEKANTEMWKYK